MMGVIVITEEDDLASEYGIDKVKNAITQPGDVLWHSQPCTGGCPWQIVNAKRSHATKLKIDAHWKEFARLWNAFQIVAQHAIDVGASVYHEWPRGCMYWGNRKVTSFLKKNNFAYDIMHGCMYGLTAVDGKDAGKPINKPWKVARSKEATKLQMK